MTAIRFSRPTTIITAALLAGLFFAGSAAAQGRGPGQGGPGKGGPGRGGCGRQPGAFFFQKADANGDGKIQKAEAQKVARARFNEVDTNKDGVITQAEAKKSAEARRQQKAGSVDDRVDWVFKRADTNQNGKIEKSESRLPAQKFELFDTNKDGALTRAELKAGMTRFRQARTPGSQMFARLDGNKDGKITRAEADQASAARFASMDTNKDGVVTREEAQAAMPQLNKGRGQRGRRGPNAQPPKGQGRTGQAPRASQGDKTACASAPIRGQARGRDHAAARAHTRSI